MNAYALSGFGCSECSETCALGVVSDFDHITVGGVTYSAAQLVDKTVIAKVDTKTYSRPGGTVTGTIQAGQAIGRVYSYLRPDQTSDGRSWLMFESTYGSPYYVPNEAVSSDGLKEQGTKTVEQQIKEEKDKEQKENDPVGYYLRKYGLPTLLIIGGIVIVGGISKEFVKGSLNRKTVTT